MVAVSLQNKGVVRVNWSNHLQSPSHRQWNLHSHLWPYRTKLTPVSGIRKSSIACSTLDRCKHVHHFRNCNPGGIIYHRPILIDCLLKLKEYPHEIFGDCSCLYVNLWLIGTLHSTSRYCYWLGKESASRIRRRWSGDCVGGQVNRRRGNLHWVIYHRPTYQGSC